MSDQLNDKWKRIETQFSGESDEMVSKDNKRYINLIQNKNTITLISMTRSQIKVHPKDSMDRLGDDLTEEVLQYLPFEDKIRLECVSKQWKRCVFQRQFVIEIHFLRSYETQNSLNGLFKRLDNKRQSDEQRLVSVMKKCPNITEVRIHRYHYPLGMIRSYYPEIKIYNIQDLFNMDLNDMPLPRKVEFGNQGIEYLLNSNRYAFDSEVLSLFGQYCPHIKSLHTMVTCKQDLQFFRQYGHKLQELSVEESKDNLKYCPNLKRIYVSSRNINKTILFDKDKEFLPNLENIENHLRINQLNINKMKILVDKYSQKMKCLTVLIIKLSAKELKTFVDCICRFVNLRQLSLSIHYLQITEPIDDCLSLIGQKCNKLLKLDLTVKRVVPISDLFFDVFTHIKAIKKLKIDLPNNKRVLSGSVECFRHCKQLTELDIDYNGLTEDFFTNIAEIFPKLQLLRLTTEQGFTNSFIDSFRSIKSLQKMEIKSRDYIKYRYFGKR